MKSGACNEEQMSTHGRKHFMWLTELCTISGTLSTIEKLISFLVKSHHLDKNHWNANLKNILIQETLMYIWKSWGYIALGIRSLLKYVTLSTKQAKVCCIHLFTRKRMEVIQLSTVWNAPLLSVHYSNRASNCRKSLSVVFLPLHRPYRSQCVKCGLMQW